MGSSWQVRAELELPDAPTVASLAPGWRWSPACFWVVNSDGVANDPQRRLVKRGGQLHTAVYRTPGALAQACGPLFGWLAPVPNYRAAMRIEVQVPGLSGDLAAVKQLCEYTRSFLPPLWPQLDPLEPLLEGQEMDALAARAACARLTATIRARHFLVSAHRHRVRMAAGTVEQFTAGEVVPRPDGRPALVMPAQEAVDVRHVAAGDWVTFRHFASTADPVQVEAAAGFAIAWIRAALQGAPATRLVKQFDGALPRQLPFVHRLEKGWAATNFHHHSRRTVAARLAQAGVYR